MKKWKKYVKGILAALFSVLGVILFIVLGIKFLRFFMPFVIGWVIAMIASPLVRMVERRMKIARKHTSMLIIIAVLAAIIGAGYFIGAKAVEETSELINQAPDIYGGFREDFREVEHNLNKFMKQLPENVQTSINNIQDDLGERIGKLVGNISEWTVGYAGDLAKHLPSVLISIIFTILSAYFFIADRDRILEFGRNNTPQIIQEKWKVLSDSFKKVFGGYFKAQFKIMAIIWAILCVGLLFLQVSFAVLVAFLISFLDMLPFFGTGTALIPWAIFKLLSGDTKFAVGLIILYLVTQLLRRIIEPKMVGDSIGMDPLLTLIFMYTGYRISSVIGMILAVPIGAVVINFYKSGMFDKPLQSVKEALEDLLEWFYRNTRDDEQIENKE
ncbi:sporulation integral membrane protein YtvI [Blautia marasmi]|uniref:sporulation integral membrane protein YtvI n=1 Tax=Blautia marasmi TaxID=1917868 RepID=UPI00266B9AE0|nr:sporulation integral membrane protein YtvI [Blautia marasmi]